MKKILSLLFVSSSLFSMQLAHKLQTQYNHLSRTRLVKAYKQRASYIPISSPIDEKKVHIDPSSIRTPLRLSDVELYHSTKKGFVVLHDDKKHVIEKAFMDKTARDMTKESLKHFVKTGYFALNQTNDGTFTLKTHYRLPGGGILGATIGAFLGKATVSIVGHGVIQLVALCTGPAYFPTMMALESCFGHAIEIASVKGAIAGGIALGTATGPV